MYILKALYVCFLWLIVLIFFSFEFHSIRFLTQCFIFSQDKKLNAHSVLQIDQITGPN